jgi:dihydroxyacetone kinase-like protein
MIDASLRNPTLISDAIEACRAAIAASVDHLCELDRKIGDGDHGTNMRRGCEAVYAERERLALLTVADATERAGRLLVENIGGASGPLYGTLLIELGRQSFAGGDGRDFAGAFKNAVDAVARRGRSEVGDKTLLDVLYPIHAEVAERASLKDIVAEAQRAAKRTVDMKAMRGRASYLGERSIGHVDPGASSCALLTGAICGVLMELEHS